MSEMQKNEMDQMTWNPDERRTVTRIDVVEAVGWDQRKTLSDLWQSHAPLPEGGLSDATYDALLAVARWGAESLWEYGEPVTPPGSTIAEETRRG